MPEFGTPKSTFFLKVKCAIFGPKWVCFGPKWVCFCPKWVVFCPKWVVFCPKWVFWVQNGFVLVQNAFFYENVENVSMLDSDRARFFTPLRVRDLTKNL